MPPALPRRRRARPVADAPIDHLLGRTRELTKGWLLALIEDAPLEGAPGVLGPRLVTQGPRLCEALLRALTDDLELRRLEPGGPVGDLAGAVGELVGAAGDPAGITRAVDALSAVMWAALRAELRSDDGELAADLAERLSLACGMVRLASLEAGADARQPPRPPPPAAPPPPPAAPQPAAPPPAAAPPPVVAPPGPAVTRPPRSPSVGSLWMSALDDEIGRAAGAPLALLLAELEDAERVAVTEGDAAAGAAFHQFAAAVRGALRPRDIFVSESDSRAWIIARATGRPDAHLLGSRVAEAVGAGPAWRGAPLTATVGLAVLGEDGRTSSELIEAAEEARFAASASGTDVAR
jgi:GGDEF domain-containing protein